MSQAYEALRRDPHLPERRAFPRARAPLINVDLGENRTGVMLDLSEGGMAVQISESIEPGTVVPIQFRISVTELAIQTTGRIIWMNSSGNAAGIQFIDLSASDQSKLKRWSEEAAVAEVRTWADSPTPAFFETRTRMPRSQNIDPAEVSGLFQVDSPRTSRARWVILAIGGLLVVLAIVAIARHQMAAKSDGSPSGESLQPSDSAPAVETPPEATAPVSKDAAPEKATAQIPPAAPAAAPAIPAAPSEIFKVPPPAPITAPAAKASAAPASGKFFQVAALRQKENADALVQALRKKQYPVVTNRRSGSELYYIVVGPFADAASLQRAKESLTRDGYQPFPWHGSPRK